MQDPSTSASWGQSTSLPCQPSKCPAEDEPASPASKLLKTYDDFKAKFEFNEQRLKDLAVEEQNLKKEFESKLKDFESRLKELEVCCAAALAD